MEMVARDFQLQSGLKGEVAGFDLEKGFSLFRFKEARERDLVLRRPWVVVGQALAVELWRPWFFPLEGPSDRPWFGFGHCSSQWSSGDECKVERSIGFARACVKLDLSRPLRPGVLIKGPKGPFWQRFVYETLDEVYLRCGHFYLPKEACPTKGKGEGASLSPENIIQASGEEREW